MPVSKRRSLGAKISRTSKSNVGKPAKNAPIVANRNLTKSASSKSGGKSKVRAVPDFSKLHQKWNDKMEAGKAYTKKPCTVAQEFNMTRSGTKFRNATIAQDDYITDNIALDGKTQQIATTGKATLAADSQMKKTIKRNLLAEIEEDADFETETDKTKEPKNVYGDKIEVPCKLIDQQKCEDIKFETDQVALNSILNNTGVPTDPYPTPDRQTFGGIICKTPGGKMMSKFNPNAMESRKSIYYTGPRQRPDSVQFYTEHTRRVLSRLTMDSVRKGNKPMISTEKKVEDLTRSANRVTIGIPQRQSIYKKYVRVSQMKTNLEETYPKEKTPSRSSPKFKRIASTVTPSLPRTPCRLTAEESTRVTRSSQKKLMWRDILSCNMNGSSPDFKESSKSKLNSVANSKSYFNDLKTNSTPVKKLGSKVKEDHNGARKSLDDSIDPTQDKDKLQELEQLEKMLEQDIEEMEKKKRKNSNKKSATQKNGPKVLAAKENGNKYKINQSLVISPLKDISPNIRGSSPREQKSFSKGSPLVKQLCEKTFKNQTPDKTFLEGQVWSATGVIDSGRSSIMSPKLRKLMGTMDKENTPPSFLPEKRDEKDGVSPCKKKHLLDELLEKEMFSTPSKTYSREHAFESFEMRTPEVNDKQLRLSLENMSLHEKEKKNYKEKRDDNAGEQSEGFSPPLAAKLNETYQSSSPRRSKPKNKTPKSAHRSITPSSKRNTLLSCTTFEEAKRESQFSPFFGSTPGSINKNTIHRLSKSDLSHNLNDSFEEFERLHSAAGALKEKPNHTRSIMKQLETLQKKQEELFKLQTVLEERLAKDSLSLISTQNGNRGEAKTEKSPKTEPVSPSIENVDLKVEQPKELSTSPCGMTSCASKTSPKLKNGKSAKGDTSLSLMKAVEGSHQSPKIKLTKSQLFTSPKQLAVFCVPKVVGEAITRNSPKMNKINLSPYRRTPTQHPATKIKTSMNSPPSPGTLSLAANVWLSPSRRCRKNLGHSALMNAANKFHEALLDEEVALYASRLHLSAMKFSKNDRCTNPIGTLLKCGDDKHFIPIRDLDFSLFMQKKI